MADVDWRLEGVELQTCNCNWGCPCQFNALPTHGDCRAAGAVRIEKGYYGETSLDGVVCAWLFAWPGPIHEGKGEAQLILDESTTDAQREAIRAIFHGEQTEPGATIFNVFTNVVDTYHPPIVGPIAFEADIEARKGRFSVPGVIEGEAGPIINPVTGDPHRARVTLPHGFEYDTAEYASGRAKSGQSAIAIDHAQSHAHLARLHWTPTGVAHA